MGKWQNAHCCLVVSCLMFWAQNLWKVILYWEEFYRPPSLFVGTGMTVRSQLFTCRSCPDLRPIVIIHQNQMGIPESPNAKTAAKTNLIRISRERCYVGGRGDKGQWRGQESVPLKAISMFQNLAKVENHGSRVPCWTSFHLLIQQTCIESWLCYRHTVRYCLLSAQ